MSDDGRRENSGTDRDCYDCDYAQALWPESRREYLLFLKKLKERAIARLERQLREIEAELQGLET